MGLGSGRRWFHCFDPPLPALITAHYSAITRCALPAFPGLLAVPLTRQTIRGADRLRAEHAFPSRVAGAFEAHVTAKSENFFTLTTRAIVS